jgi:hypothetical protein
MLRHVLSAVMPVAHMIARLIGPPDADGEYIALGTGTSDEEIVHLHDYERIYGAPVMFTIDERWMQTDGPGRIPSSGIRAAQLRRAPVTARVALPAPPVDHGNPDPLRTRRCCERQRRTRRSRPVI